MPPIEYDSTVRVRRRCGLMSDYFDRLLATLKGCSTVQKIGRAQADFFREVASICRARAVNDNN